MEEEIDLKSIFNMFWDRKIGIIVIILLCIVAGYVYTTFFVTPVYEATSTAILTSNNESSSDEGGTTGVTQTEVTLNNSLLSTYREIATSDSVVSKVISNLVLNISDDALKSQITVTSATSSQVIQITVENENAELAAKIANEIRQVFTDRVAELYDMQNIKSLDDAKVPTSPSNINHTKDIVMFAAIGVVLAVIYVVIANLLDNTVKSSSDIEKATGLNVIAEIPVYEFNGRGRKR